MSNITATYDTYRATRHFGSLDGLRFICITLVIWHHLPLWPQWEHIFFARGHVGVDFFFVLSGYLITTLLLREESAKGSFSLRGFYWRRILRIIPIYFFVVTLAATYSIVIKGQTEYLSLLPYYPLFLSNFMTEHIPLLDPTWSLAMEEQYYLVWPLLLTLLPRGWIAPVLVLLIGANLAGVLGAFTRIGITGHEVGPLHFQLNGATYAPILMGTLAAVMLHNRQAFGRIAPYLNGRWTSWVLFTSLLIALALLPDILEGWPNLLVHLLMTLMLVSLVIREDNGMAPILQLRPVVRIGQISYGIYLYHLFALTLVGKAFETFGLQGLGWVFVLYYALSILFAEISFRTLEAWFLGLKHKPWKPMTASSK